MSDSVRPHKQQPTSLLRSWDSPGKNTSGLPFPSPMHESEKLSEVTQSCPTLCDPIDSSPPGCPVPGILQARTLEWVAISFSKAWKWKLKVKSLSRVWPQGPHGLQPSRLLHPWDFPRKSTGVGCHCLLRWMNIIFTNSKTLRQPCCFVQLLSCVWIFETPWIVAYQVPLSVRLSRKEYWNGLPFPFPGDLPNPRIKPASPAFAGRLFISDPPGKP